jgi:soluble cytochrome b562
VKNVVAHSLLDVAASLSAAGPLSSLEAGRDVLAVVNPGREKFHDHVEKTMSVVKSLKQELSQALKDYETAEEFAKFFSDGFSEEDELRKLLKKGSSKAASAELAGLGDVVKNLFKKKEKPKPADADHAQEWGETDSGPSYRMDDSQMDDFVDGRRDWKDPGQYVEEEAKENKEFSSKADSILSEMDAARKNPSKGAVEKLLKAVDVVLRHGENILKGAYKHLEGPSAPKSDSDRSGDVKNSPSKRPPSPPRPKKTDAGLEAMIGDFANRLKENSGNESRLKSTLRELFQAVGPLLGDPKAASGAVQIATSLIRIAHANPASRPVLLPVIRRLTGS